jgi:hypothetical protein
MWYDGICPLDNASLEQVFYDFVVSKVGLYAVLVIQFTVQK